MKLFAIAMTAALLSGCAMNRGGYEGHYINDALPSDARLLKAELYDREDTRDIPGTENDFRADLDWNVFEHSVPCSAIKAVHYWASGIDKDEAGLRLVGHIYGGEYYPYPPSGSFWYTPELWVEPINRDAAEKLAMHCGVEFVIRRG